MMICCVYEQSNANNIPAHLLLRAHLLAKHTSSSSSHSNNLSMAGAVVFQGIALDNEFCRLPESSAPPLPFPSSTPFNDGAAAIAMAAAVLPSSVCNSVQSQIPHAHARKPFTHVPFIYPSKATIVVVNATWLLPSSPESELCRGGVVVAQTRTEAFARTGEQQQRRLRRRRRRTGLA